jgi:DNA-binding Lrp family transcriptional regulator
MDELEPNLYFKILSIIKNTGVSSFRHIAKSIDVSEELVKIIIQSLLEKGYLTLHDNKIFHEEASFACKFCPFSKECSERIPTIFYELSQKGIDKIKSIETN